MPAFLESIIGGSIDRVLYMFAKTGVLLKIGIAEQDGQLTFRVVLLHASQTTVGQVGLSLAGIEQEEVIPRLVHLFVGGILVGQAGQLLLGQTVVLQLILEDHTGIIQTIHDNQVALGFLFVGKGYLCQVVLAVVRVVGQCVGLGRKTVLALSNIRVLRVFQTAQAVGNFLCAFHVQIAYNGLVRALPVVGILTLAPLLLERLFTLVHGHLVVEIPLTVGGGGRLWGGGTCGLVTVTHGTLLLLDALHLGLKGFVTFLLFFLLQCFNDAVDSCQTVFLGHVGQLLQGVLQMNGIRIRYQFVKNLGAFGQHLVVVTLLVEQSDSLAIAALRIIVFLELPVKVAQF